MTKAEIVRLFISIVTMYSEAKWASEATQMTVDEWYFHLEQYPRETVEAAFRRHVTNSPYPPKVSDIIAEIRLLAPLPKEKQQLTAEEAWALVLMAVKNSGYYSKREFDKLPPDIKRRVGSPEVLKQWALAEDEGQTISVARANFIRSYSEDVRERRNEPFMPVSIRTTLDKPDPVAQLVEANTVAPEDVPTQPNETEDERRERLANTFFACAEQMRKKAKEAKRAEKQRP